MSSRPTEPTSETETAEATESARPLPTQPGGQARSRKRSGTARKAASSRALASVGAPGNTGSDHEPPAHLVNAVPHSAALFRGKNTIFEGVVVDLGADILASWEPSQPEDFGLEEMIERNGCGPHAFSHPDAPRPA